MCSNAMVVPQLKEIQDSILRTNPTIEHELLEQISTNAFEQKYFIPASKAIQLWHDNQWERWLAKHQPEFSRTITSQKLKAIDDEHGRFVEYDIITSDVDRADLGGEKYPDLIPPETIAKVEKQLMGSIITMKDPAKILDYPAVKKKYTTGSKFGGIGHEHHFDQDIVPILEIVKVKALDDNSRLRVTAKLNEYSQRADDAWAMIKNKTLGYASVEMKELASDVRRVGDRYVNVITDMLIGGWTITSKAVNGAAAQVGCFVKALDQSIILENSISSLIEDNQKEKMADEEIQKEEETLTETQPVEEVKVEEPISQEPDPETPPEAPNAEVELEKVKALEEKVKALEEKLKALDADKELADSVVGELTEKVKASLESESKALVEPNQEKFEEKVKALEEKVKAENLSIDERFTEIAKLHNELI